MSASEGSCCTRPDHAPALLPWRIFPAVYCRNCEEVTEYWGWFRKLAWDVLVYWWWDGRVFVKDVAVGGKEE